jgi:hypothetical protein
MKRWRLEVLEFGEMRHDSFWLLSSALAQYEIAKIKPNIRQLVVRDMWAWSERNDVVVRSWYPR